MPGIADVAKKSGIDTKGVKEVIDAIKSFTANGEKVQLQGFGTFKQATRKARTARNPATGETIQVPEKTVLTFKASK